jgi:hypothetical protein
MLAPDRKSYGDPISRAAARTIAASRAVGHSSAIRNGSVAVNRLRGEAVVPVGLIH